MTQDEIIEMAQECGLVGMRPHLDGIYIESLLAFAKLVADKALAEHAMRETQRLGQEIEPDEIASILACRDMLDAQPVPPRTWIGLEGAEFGWFCHTDFLNARKYTKEQRKKICDQLLSEAQSWDGEEYQLMMHDSTKRPFIGLTDDEKNDCLVSADPCEALAEPEARQLIEDVEQALKERNQ